jgi:phage FluMu protein Com
MQEYRCPYEHPDRPGLRCDALLFKAEGDATIERACQRCRRLVLTHCGDYTAVEVDNAALVR